MLRLTILGAVALATGAVPTLAGGDPHLHRRGGYLPPEVAYRDPAYLPPPPMRFAPIVQAPVVLVPRHLNVPLYNEPPQRFPNP